MILLGIVGRENDHSMTVMAFSILFAGCSDRYRYPFVSIFQVPKSAPPNCFHYSASNLHVPVYLSCEGPTTCDSCHICGSGASDVKMSRLERPWVFARPNLTGGAQAAKSGHGGEVDSVRRAFGKGFDAELADGADLSSPTDK
jgi:hypothetical protein